METKEQIFEALEDFKDRIKKVEIAMLTTIEADGTMRSRPMATREMDASGALWFFTNEFSAKVEEISKNSHVSVTYSDPGSQLYISLSGSAHLVTESKKIEQLWDPILKAWFPEGLDDPKLALLKVDINQGEYWDASSSKLVRFIKIIKALIKGKEYEGGDHKKVTI